MWIIGYVPTAAGLARAVSWAGRRIGGDLKALWVIESIGTYGARLAHAASDGPGYRVVEAARMNARANRGIGKCDPLDARRIAQAVLCLDVTWQSSLACAWIHRTRAYVERRTD